MMERGEDTYEIPILVVLIIFAREELSVGQSRRTN